eukprot:TRINITY_DN10549_c0_g1_i1.p1 TRINITY_DN10549_c0_g1~~TRINITY_DN10549_c0_g1_i1.p1  ORF type:complete len:282 (+),score=30.58 TRINITY_DN10549_c0_g1_i1:134-979(+)
MTPPAVATGRVVSSTESHGRGLGLSAKAGGNPFANCSVPAPCVTARGVKGIALIYDDTIGYVGLAMPTTSLGHTFHTAEVTQSLRAGMAEAGLPDVRRSGTGTRGRSTAWQIQPRHEAELQRRRLLNDPVRIVAADSQGLIGVTSHGSPVQGTFLMTRRALDALDDPVVAAMCGALSAALAVPAGVTSLVPPGAPCTLPAAGAARRAGLCADGVCGRRARGGVVWKRDGGRSWARGARCVPAVDPAGHAGRVPWDVLPSPAADVRPGGLGPVRGAAVRRLL